MKKNCISFLLSGIIILSAVLLAWWFQTEQKPVNAEYFRIHIRADSDENEDQAVKYEVRDAVVELLTPVVATANTRDEAVEAIKKNIPLIEDCADRVLRENGFFYGAKANVREEEFPTRVYGDCTLEEGVYLALILNLGSGKGANWWCVVYPPLCFANTDAPVYYKSLILEKIQAFKNKR